MLASVRSLAEARLVAAAGVDWIDLKEPSAGALGAVDTAVVSAVSSAYGSVHRISATIGDCWHAPAEIPARVRAMSAAGAQYVKVGAYLADPAPALLAALRDACASSRVIVVAFAEAPPAPADLVRVAATGIVGLMLDTAVKQGPRLRELLDDATLAAFVEGARGLGLLTGLAGRLHEDDIPPLLALAPDYLGFRGALCGADTRTGDIDPARVAHVRRCILSRSITPA